MMASQIDDKQIRRRAKDLLKQGIGKQEVYQLLIQEFENRNRTAQILKRLPSKKAWEKYGVWNHVLSTLMTILFLLMMFFTRMSIGTILWYGLPTLAILLVRTRFYVWVVIIAALGLIGISTMALSAAGELGTGGLMKIAIFFLLLAPAAFLALWLPKRLTPAPNEEREVYVNEYGAERSRIIFSFLE